MTTLFAAIVLLGVIVFVHELGHYLAARSIGVKVERFPVGCPPRLMTFTSVKMGGNFDYFFIKKINQANINGVQSMNQTY